MLETKLLISGSALHHALGLMMGSEHQTNILARRSPPPRTLTPTGEIIRRSRGADGSGSLVPGQSTAISSSEAAMRRYFNRHLADRL